MSAIRQTEPEAIANALSEIMGARFKVYEPAPGFPPEHSKVDWLVRCSALQDAPKVFHIDAIWRVGQEIIIETGEIGSISEWIYLDYGDAALGRVQEMDLSDFTSSVNEQLFGRYPKTRARLENAEHILTTLSAKSGIGLRIRSDGTKGTVIFYLQAKIPAGDLDSEISQIRESETALREAVDKIVKL